MTDQKPPQPPQTKPPQAQQARPAQPAGQGSKGPIGPAQAKAKPQAPKPTLRDEVLGAMDAFNPAPVAALSLDCIEGGYVGRRQAGTLHGRFQAAPCNACLVVLHAMIRSVAMQDDPGVRRAQIARAQVGLAQSEVAQVLGVRPWPEARMKSHECDECPEWHWDLVDVHGVGVMRWEEGEDFEAHANCKVFFAIFERELRVVATPATCAACALALPEFGKIKSVITGQEWPIERDS